jgi:hypothetical protein
MLYSGALPCSCSCWWCWLVDLHLDLFCCFLIGQCLVVWCLDLLKHALKAGYEDFFTLRLSSFLLKQFLCLWICESSPLPPPQCGWLYVQEKHFDDCPSDCQRDRPWRCRIQMVVKFWAEENSTIDHGHQAWTTKFYTMPAAKV